jgi:AmiR/NasT family two-component response regulator
MVERGSPNGIEQGARVATASVNTFLGKRPLPNGRFDVLVVCPDAVMGPLLRDLVVSLPASLVDADAVDGLSAARICSIAHPAAVVLDVSEPGGDQDVLGISSASPATAVVVFTALADRRSIARLLRAGAAAVVAKGDAADLQHEIARLRTRRAV